MADVGLRVQGPVEIGDLDRVVVDKYQPTYPRLAELRRDPTTYCTDAEDHNFCIGQPSKRCFHVVAWDVVTDEVEHPSPW